MLVRWRPARRAALHWVEVKYGYGLGLLCSVICLVGQLSGFMGGFAQRIGVEADMD